MDTLELKFATPRPVSFKEKDCDGVFEARMYGEAVVTGMEADPGEENATTYLRDLIVGQITEAFANWDPERRVVTDDICEIMGQKLEDPTAWTCSACGYAENTGKYCTECGAKRTE